MSFVTFIIYFIGLASIIYGIAIWNWRRRHLYRLSYKLPGAFAWPLIGNGLSFFCKPELLLNRLLKLLAYSSPCRLWLGPKLCVMITDPENCQRILTSSKITHKDGIYRFIAAVSGNGLIPLSGEVWKSHRKVIQPTFKNDILNSYMTIFCQQSDILTDKLASRVGKATFDITKFSHLCTVDVVMETIIDVKVNAQFNQQKQLVKALERGYTMVHERMVKIWLHPDFIYFRTALGREHVKVTSILQEYLSNAVRKKRNEMRLRAKNREVESEAITRKCTIEHLLELMEADPKVITEQEIIDEAGVLFTASEDTTSINYSFTMMMLGMYPEVQSKVYAELIKVVGDKQVYDIEILNNLKYLEMVIKESLRLIPIGPFILRKVTEEFEMGDLVLPIGSTCVLSIYSIHRDPNQWERPNEFYPDHHLPDKVRHPYAFVPFSGGVRSCVGRHYAMFLIKTMVAKTILKYRVEAGGKFEDLTIYSDISCRIKGGCRVRLFNR